MGLEKLPQPATTSNVSAAKKKATKDVSKDSDEDIALEEIVAANGDKDNEVEEMSQLNDYENEESEGGKRIVDCLVFCVHGYGH